MVVCEDCVNYKPIIEADGSPAVQGNCPHEYVTMACSGVEDCFWFKKKREAPPPEQKRLE